MAVSPSSTEELLVEQRDRIVVLTLNRPERLNAISGAMLGELSAKMVEANRDPDTRCIVLTGAGRGFCAGLDLVAVNEGGIGSRAQRQGDNRPRALLDLTLLADIRIASESAKMAAVTAKRNVVPESGGTWLLPRLIGWAKAAELYYRARTIDAAECLSIGLVNAVVPNDELMPTAMQWAQEIADNAPMAVQTTKRMMRMGLEESYDTAVDHLMVHLNGMFQSDDFQEGVSAFLERRKPNFTGR